MNRNIKAVLTIALLAGLVTGCATSSSNMTKGTHPVIVHSVFFTLKHEAGSTQESDFFTKAEKLVSIDGVKNFRVLKEVSPKNPYTYGFSMEFATQADYDRYNNHPDHKSFVQDVWMNEVAEFQEIDYVVMK